MPQGRKNVPEKRKDVLSLWLDCFRWTSALLVVFTHANNRFLVKVFSLPHGQRSLGHYAFALLSGFGHQAVVVFFVLSGMFVGGGSLRFFQRTGTVDAKGYALKRVTRLWVVLIPSFATTFLFDRVGASIFPAGGSSPYNPLPEHGLAALACNAAFLQTALCSQYGTDGALWSLFDEFWYYAAWLLVLLGCSAIVSWPRRALFFAVPSALLLALSSVQFIGSNVAAYSVIWLLGVLASARNRPLVAMGVLPMAGIVVAHLLLVRGLVPTEWADATFGVWFACDASLSLLFVNLLLCMKAKAHQLPEPPGGLLHKRLASFAFSLYCTHPPLLNLYAAVAMFYFGTGWQMVPTRPAQWIYVAGGVSAAVAFSYLFSLATETRTDAIRRFIERLVSQRASEPAAELGPNRAR